MAAKNMFAHFPFLFRNMKQITVDKPIKTLISFHLSHLKVRGNAHIIKPSHIYYISSYILCMLKVYSSQHYVLLIFSFHSPILLHCSHPVFHYSPLFLPQDESEVRVRPTCFKFSARSASSAVSQRMSFYPKTARVN